MTWVGPEAVSVDIVRLEADLKATAQNTLNRIISAEDREQLGAVAAIRTGSAIAMEIATYAREEGIDLILMGTHGRGTMGHLFMGNVAEKVVRIAPCPVLTVRHPEHEFIQPDALMSVGRVKR